MKKIRIVLAAIICAVLLASVFVNTVAEPAGAENWQADIRKLMDPANVPHITEIRSNDIEGDSVKTHDVACEITNGTQSFGCEFTFALDGAKVSDWEAIQRWLGDIVTHAAATAGADSEAIAKAIDRAIIDARKNVESDENGKTPEWAQEGLKVALIRVSTPFYPELSIDKNGEATKRLQQKLIELGYLEGKADGYFGQKTEQAVKALEGYIRELEQDAIEAHLAETPAPTATPTPTPTATPSPTPTAAPTPEATHELTLVVKDAPEETQPPAELEFRTPEPTEAPASEEMEEAIDLPIPEPVTPVDGVADALLQAYLYSADFRPARRALASGDQGEDVTRLQRRLQAMGCTVSVPDGIFGGGTSRAVRIFQYFNGLDQTGRADLETLNRIFSANAKAPDHGMLTMGVSGEDVRKLQTRLRELGFTTAATDGSYGANTKTAVERLQKYMRDREQAAISTSADAKEDVTAQLTVEVNGIADPILLNDFYAASFPTVPGTLKSGSSGGDVTRLQRRLTGLEYFYGAVDGSYGAGTAEAVKGFQKRHGLAQDGVAGAETLRILFSGDAKKALKPYLLKVSTKDQRVYAYAPDMNGEYTELVRTMKCSTGKSGNETPKGTYQSTTGPGARWHYFKKFECWAQYAYYIQGDIMFHSVLYNEQGGRVTQSSVNNLGRKASHGCVRLSVEDAKWIYTNCPSHTKVVVY